LFDCFPTILLFVGGPDGLVVPYEGDRDMAAIVDFVTDLAVPKVQEWVGGEVSLDGTTSPGGSSKDDGKTYAHMSLPAADAAAAKRMTSKFEAACKRVAHLSCYVSPSQSESVVSATLTIFEAMEGKTTPSRTIPNEITAESLVEMLRLKSYPRVVPMQKEFSVDYIFAADRPGYKNHFILLIDGEETEESQRILSNARVTTDSIPGEAIWMYIDTRNLSPFQENILKQIKVDKTEAPIGAAVLSKESAMQFYINSDGNLDDHMLLMWAQAVLAGEVTPTDIKKFDEDGDEIQND